MTQVFYILEDDLLKHLPYCNAAVNLTTCMEPWKLGLSRAYAEKFPSVYKRYKESQDEFKVAKSEPIVDRENDKHPYVVNLPLKTSRTDTMSDKDLKKALANLSEVCKDYNDVIMPIIITGTLSESLDTMKKYLDNKYKTRFWVGISKSRAEKEDLEKDDTRIFISSSVNVNKKYVIKTLAKDNYVLGNGAVYMSQLSLGDPNKISHWCDVGYAFIDEDKPNIKFNSFIQQLMLKGLGVKFVPIIK